MALNFTQGNISDEQDSGYGHDPAVERMQALVQQWQSISDNRAIFLSCYLMMTRNMHHAIKQNEFHDAVWVDALLHRFADYYFTALDAYERDELLAPPVWQVAHNAARQHDATPLQELLLGVNAHINYDLVLALVDLLEPEWESLTEEQQSMRYSDHCHVNDVIGCTIDAVQDQVLEPAMPMMDLIDRFLGPLDEKLISHLLAGWREKVWENALRVLQTREPDDRAQLVHQVEEHALQLGRRIA